MSLRTDKVQLEIIIKGDKTRMELSQLETKSKQLARELKRLPESSDEFVKKSAEFKKVQQRMDELKRSIGLAGMTIRELENKQRELNMALKNMDPRTPKYKELRAELLLVKNRMYELNGQAKQTGFSMNKMAEGFNKYFALLAAFSASIAGVILSMRKMVDEFSNFEKATSNLSALTGLEGESLDWLSDKAKEMSTSMVDGNIRITKSAEDIVNAYTMVGSKMPELLSDQESLNEVTKQALVLAESANIDLEIAVDSLTNTMNQFSLPASEAANVINQMAAGAKYGAADIDYVGASIVRFGAAANAMNVDVTQSVALIEVMGKAGLDAEKAGTGLKTFLLKSASLADEFNVSVSGLDAVIHNLANANLSAAEMTEMFGLEAYIAAQSLITNIDVYDDLIGKIEGTNVAYEMAAINTNNHASAMEQARNKAKVMSIEIGEKLAPAMMFSTNAARKFILTLFELPRIVRENKNLFILLGAALLIVYQRQILLLAETIKSYAWGDKSIVQIYKNIKAKITEALVTQGATTATNFQTKAVILLNAAWKKFPLGFIIAGLTAIYFAFEGISRLINKTSNEQKLLNDINKRSSEIVNEQQAQLAILANQIQATNEGTEERKKVINQLNEEYGHYLPNLLTENSSYDEIKKSLMLINAELLTKARLQAVSEKMMENQKKLLDLYDQQAKAIKTQREVNKVTDRSTWSWMQGLIDSTQQSIDQLHAENKELINMQQNLNAIGNASSSSGPSPIGTPVEIIEEQTEAINEGSNAVDKFVNKNIDAEVELYLSYVRDLENLRKALDLKQISQQEYYNSMLFLNSQYRAKIDAQTEVDPDLYIPDITKQSDKMSQSEIMKAHDDAMRLISEEKATRLEAINSIMNAESFSFSQKQEGLLRQYENGFILEEEYNQALLDLKEQHWSKIEELATKHAAKLVETTISTIDTWQNAQFDKEITHINEKYALEFQKLDDLYNNKRISEESYQAEKRALELELAEDEKILKIKQANREAALKKLEIGVQAAKTLFEIKAQIAAYIASANVPMAVLAGTQIPLLLGSSIAQIAAIDAAKNKQISEFAVGKYPLMGQSGKIWNVSYGGRAKTGYVSNPTHFIAGDGAPEMIIDYPTLKNIQLNAPEILSTIMQMRVQERATGQYPVSDSSSSTAAANPAFDSNSTILQVETLKILKSIDDKLSRVYSFKDLYDKLDEVDQQYQKINENFTA